VLWALAAMVGCAAYFVMSADERDGLPPIVLAAGGLAAAAVALAALGFLGLLQITATILNLLPVPGLDGFAILEPWLPRTVRRAALPSAQYGLLLVFVVLSLPEINRAFFGAVFSLTAIGGITGGEISLAHELYRFWQ
jgi:Zn-dependent protease